MFVELDFWFSARVRDYTLESATPIFTGAVIIIIVIQSCKLTNKQQGRAHSLQMKMSPVKILSQTAHHSLRCDKLS